MFVCVYTQTKQCLTEYIGIYCASCETVCFYFSVTGLCARSIFLVSDRGVTLNKHSNVFVLVAKYSY